MDLGFKMRERGTRKTVTECIWWLPMAVLYNALFGGMGMLTPGKQTLRGNRAESPKIPKGDLMEKRKQTYPNYDWEVEVSGRSVLIHCKNDCLTIIQQWMGSFLRGAEKGPTVRTVQAEGSKDVVMWIPEVGVRFNWWPPRFLPALG